MGHLRAEMKQDKALNAMGKILLPSYEERGKRGIFKQCIS